MKTVTARIWRQLPVQRRGFSTTRCRLDNYAFIGLGQMVCSFFSRRTLDLKRIVLTCNHQGYQMARNLQAKLPPTDNIRLFDINTAAAEKLAHEMKGQAAGARAHVSESAASASQYAVCEPQPNFFTSTPLPQSFHDEFVQE